MTSSWASRVLDADAERVFAAITTLEMHRDLIPFTDVDAPDRPVRRGDRIVATSLGLLRDTMLVTAARAPEGDRRGVVEFAKAGPVLLGQARIAVTALGRPPAGWTGPRTCTSPHRWAGPTRSPTGCWQS